VEPIAGGRKGGCILTPACVAGILVGRRFDSHRGLFARLVELLLSALILSQGGDERWRETVQVFGKFDDVGLRMVGPKVKGHSFQNVSFQSDYLPSLFLESLS